MNAVTLSLTSPVTSSLTGVLANTVNISAMPPLLIHILLPFNIQCLPSAEGTALVLIEAASEPLAGSVKANAAIVSPVASFGKYLAFCSLLPNNKMPLKPIDLKNLNY